ncbi:hypothetical protein ABLO26_24560 [Neobacillus sp. 179-J 1A1 HS]|uniref:hypothetical protein n=1 Tax=Neobacillus driksii TaxID=3035913 RepID=UPI0035BC0385
MNDWIIITPEGITESPNEIVCENFQVLGFTFAKSEEAALKNLKEKYPYLNGSGFDEVWIYKLASNKPLIKHLGKEQMDEQFEDEFEREMVKVNNITRILKDNGYTDICFDYRDEEFYFFEGYTDAHLEIRVEVKEENIEIYDRYLSEKHFVHFGNFKLSSN